MRTLKEIQNNYYTRGVKSLNDAELLSLLGINLEECDFYELLQKNNEELIRQGHRPSTARKLNALGEIAHRYSLNPKPELVSIKSSTFAADLLRPILKDLDHEEFWLLYLNRANKVIKMERLSIGGLCATVVDIKLIMKRALELLASGLIMAHNHPSGNNVPGEADREQTNRIKDAARLFDISLLDHIIIAGNKYYSFADEGQL